MCKNEREVEKTEVLKSLFAAVALEISLMTKSMQVEYSYFINQILSLLYGIAENRIFFPLDDIFLTPKNFHGILQRWNFTFCWNRRLSQGRCA